MNKINYTDTLEESECKEIVWRIWKMMSKPNNSSGDIVAKEFLLKEDLKEILRLHDRLNHV